MDRYNFSNVNLLLVDPEAENLEALHPIFCQMGFQNICAETSIGPAKRHELDRRPDFLIGAFDLPEDDFCDFVRLIRHGDTEYDPFMPVITTISEATAENVGRAVNSGSDLILAKPMSLDQLANSVKTIVDNRKSFVVTSNYIGPDRQKSRSRNDSAALIEVPNVLRAKALNSRSAASLHETISETKWIINRQKIECHARQIAVYAEFVRLNSKDKFYAERVEEVFREMLSVSQDLQKRARGTAFEVRVSEPCAILVPLVQKILASEGALHEKSVELLMQLSKAIYTIFWKLDENSPYEAARQEEHDSSDEAASGATSGKAASAVKDPAAKRQKFLLRLLVSKISPLIMGEEDGKSIPRAFIQGFDSYLMMVLGENQYVDLNYRARDILEGFNTDIDEEIWQQVMDSGKTRILTFGILTRILAKFENVKKGRDKFLTIANTALSKNAGGGPRDSLNERHFNLALNTLCEDLFETCANEVSASLLANEFGEKTIVKIRQISEALNA